MATHVYWCWSKNDPICAVAKNEDCPKAIPQLVSTLLFRQPLADLSLIDRQVDKNQIFGSARKQFALFWVPCRYSARRTSAVPSGRHQAEKCGARLVISTSSAFWNRGKLNRWWNRWQKVIWTRWSQNPGTNPLEVATKLFPQLAAITWTSAKDWLIFDTTPPRPAAFCAAMLWLRKISESVSWDGLWRIFSLIQGELLSSKRGLKKGGCLKMAMVYHQLLIKSLSWHESHGLCWWNRTFVDTTPYT